MNHGKLVAGLNKVFKGRTLKAITTGVMQRQGADGTLQERTAVVFTFDGSRFQINAEGPIGQVTVGVGALRSSDDPEGSAARSAIEALVRSMGLAHGKDHEETDDGLGLVSPVDHQPELAHVSPTQIAETDGTTQAMLQTSSDFAKIVQTLCVVWHGQNDGTVNVWRDSAFGSEHGEATLQGLRVEGLLRLEKQGERERVLLTDTGLELMQTLAACLGMIGTVYRVNRAKLHGELPKES